MSEEAIGIMKDIVDESKVRFWIEGSGLKYKLHLRCAITVGSDEYKKLLSLSTSGRNEAVKTLAQKIWERMLAGVKSTGDNEGNDTDYECSVIEDRSDSDNIGESILASIADDIKVSVTKERVELVIIKTTHS